MSHWRRLLVIGVLTLIVGLIVKFPARVAYHWFAPPEIAVAGIEGTVWRGTAQSADIGGFYVGDVEWRFRPFGLFTGRLSYSVSARPQFGTLVTDVALSPGGAITLTAMESNVSLQPFDVLIGVRGMRGTAAVQFDRLKIADGFIAEAEGSVDIRGLVVPQVSREPIGAYRVELSTQETGIVASIVDTDGLVDVAGTLTLTAGRSYSLLAVLAAKPETPQQLRQQIEFLPRADAPGRHELRLEGQL